MGQFTYEEQGTYTWLVYRIGDDEEIDSLSLGMLTKNKVLGIMPIVYTPLNNTDYIKYNVSSRVSVKNYLTGMVNCERMLSVFSGIVNAMTSAESYMLDVNSLILDTDYIFVNVSTRETNMICVPVMVTEQRHMDLAGFFRNILFTIQFDPSENFDYVTRIVNYLNSTQMFSLAEFNKLVNKIRQEREITGTISPRSADAGNIPAKPHKEVAVRIPTESAEDNHTAQSSRQLGEFPGDFGGIAIPGIPGKAELPENPKGNRQKKAGLFNGFKSRHKMSEEAGKEKKDRMKHGNMPIPPFADAPPEVSIRLGDIPMTDDDIGVGIQYGATADDFEMPGTVTLSLQYITEDRRIAVPYFPFEIGREGSGLKIDVSKTKISRRHAVITQVGDCFLITDFSKHGTFLDGERIPQGEPRVLKNGMRVLLKTEEFEVKIDKA